MGLVPARRPGWLLEPRCKSGPRGMAAQSPLDRGDGQNPAYRPSGKLHAATARGTVQRGNSSFGLLAKGPATLYIGGTYGSAEKIRRLGIPALAALREGARRRAVAAVRP